MAGLNKQIEEKLREFWAECQLDEELDADLFGAVGVKVDSLTACDVLVVLEPIIGVKLEAEKIIRAGGYDSEEQFVTDIMGRVLSALENGPKKTTQAA